MAIYEIKENGLSAITPTTFAEQGIKERSDLQRLLCNQVDIISPDTMIIAEEFGDWTDSRRRIDLLGIDKNGNLVVIELKRTEDGGHMELQALRYAAMVSTMTFEKCVEIYTGFHQSFHMEGDPRELLLEFLEIEEPDDDNFGQDVRIVLASAEFSKELTSAVLWLNERNLDIRCVRMRPYHDGAKILIDVETVIPLPEAEEYQVQLREKKQKERQARSSGRDFSRFDVSAGGLKVYNLPKRGLMLAIVRAVVATGVHPDDIADTIVWRKNNMFVTYPGELSEDEFVQALMKTDKGGKLPRWRRFFCKEDELFRIDGNTYALSNQWGNRTLEAVEVFKNKYPSLELNVSKTGM